MTKSYDLKPNNRCLTDFGYEDIKILDDDIVIYFSGELVTTKIICSMYIGYQHIGKWDEGIVDYAIVEEHGELLDRSLAMLNKNHSEKYLKSSAPLPINKWLLLKVFLIDGTSIEVVCNSVTLEFDN